MSILIFRRRHHTVPPYLVFSTQPVGAASGSNWATQPVVTAKNPDGTTKTSFTGVVTLALNALTGTPTLTGTATATAVAGVATFSGLGTTGGASTWTVTATATGYSSATSSTGTTTAAASGVTDTFTRSGASLGTADSGQAWTQQSGTITTDGANATQPATGIAFATIDSGLSDCTVATHIGNTGFSNAGVIVRWVDANNYLAVALFNGNLYVKEKKAGVSSTPGAGTPLAPATSSPGDLLQVVLNGSSVTTKYRGTTVHTLTINDFTTSTVHGLYTEAAMIAIWQDFSVAP